MDEEDIFRLLTANDPGRKVQMRLGDNVRLRMLHSLHIRPARHQTRPRPLARNHVLYAGRVLAVTAVGLL